MLQKKLTIFFILIGFMTLSGCALLVGGAAVGAGAAGTYLYVKGEVITDYQAPFEAVWTAVEKTVADMHGLDIERNKEIAKGAINTAINNEKAFFSVQYKDKNLTTVSIRIGISGDKVASQMLHDKIADYLKK